MITQSFNLKHEVSSLTQALIGLALLGLILLGIGGTIYKILAPDGWIAHLFGRSVTAGSAAVGSLAVLAVLAWFSRGWTSVGQKHTFSEIVVFGFAFAGLVFAAELLLKGSF